MIVRKENGIIRKKKEVSVESVEDQKQNILNNAGAGFLISSTGVIHSTGAWGV